MESSRKSAIDGPLTHDCCEESPTDRDDTKVVAAPVVLSTANESLRVTMLLYLTFKMQKAENMFMSQTFVFILVADDYL